MSRNHHPHYPNPTYPNPNYARKSDSPPSSPNSTISADAISKALSQFNLKAHIEAGCISAIDLNKWLYAHAKSASKNESATFFADLMHKESTSPELKKDMKSIASELGFEKMLEARLRKSSSPTAALPS